MKTYTFKSGQHIIPIGTRVRIKADANVIPTCIRGQEYTVTGYIDEGKAVSCITPLYLDRGKDVTFRYPTVFPWQVEIIKE